MLACKRTDIIWTSQYHSVKVSAGPVLHTYPSSDFGTRFEINLSLLCSELVWPSVAVICRAPVVVHSLCTCLTVIRKGTLFVLGQAHTEHLAQVPSVSQIPTAACKIRCPNSRMKRSKKVQIQRKSNSNPGQMIVNISDIVVCI